MEMDSDPTELTTEQIKEAIPQEYEFIKTLSSGGYGQVVKCKKKDTREVVAIKLPIFNQDTEEEIGLLRRLMDQGSDQRHIVKFFGAFNTNLGKGMIFEKLDLSVAEFWEMYQPLPLSDIRDIIKQVAIALEVLKDMSVIHTDLKRENVMVCNRNQWPLHVKLIDFGLAIPTVEAKAGMRIHHECYRPPEVLLGLPFNEAVDVWALGTMMAEFMLRGDGLFPERTEYETFKVIVKVLGIPSRVDLDKGIRTHLFYSYDGENWIFMTLWEVLAIYGYLPQKYYTEDFRSLRELMQFSCKFSSLEEDRGIEAATLLLGRMLEIDPKKRITPSEILQHPFICDELESSSVPPGWMDQEDSEKFNKPLTREEIKAILPEGFKVTDMLGNGRFGQWFKCRRPGTRKNVTIKLPFSNNRTQHEVQLLKRMAENELDQKNIVKFVETLQTNRGEALVLEKLNMDLASYIQEHHPLPMSDIRAIVQQTATALQTLESEGIIHTGVMLKNVWLCHRSNEPIKIKLADFGAFIERKRALPGMTAQQVHYRAPEIILGLPFDQAIDVWSLGCMLVTVLTGISLFPDRTEFETLRTMIKLFGQPPDDVLNEATKTHEFFRQVEDSWTLITARQFEHASIRPQVTIKTHPVDRFKSLDKVIKSHIRRHNYENTELSACINLIKAMLNMDGTQRITPAQILEHNFICMSREVGASVPEEQVDSIQKPVKSPVIIMVEPASSENTKPFDDYDESQRMESEMEATPDTKEKTKMSKPRVLFDESQTIVSLEKDNQQCERPKKQKKPRWRSRVAPMSIDQPTADILNYFKDMQTAQSEVPLAYQRKRISSSGFCLGYNVPTVSAVTLWTKYAGLGLTRVGLPPDLPLDPARVEAMLEHQGRVVVFFSLALLLAPVVESLVLLDRIIYLQENGVGSQLVPLFNPNFSPRNFVLVALKQHR